jgi:hypothetical protein
MPKALVQELLHEIDNLIPADRLTLERELARRLEAEWKIESAKARKTARAQKIDQKRIDHVIERRRYRT